MYSHSLSGVKEEIKTAIKNYDLITFVDVVNSFYDHEDIMSLVRKELNNLRIKEPIDGEEKERLFAIYGVMKSLISNNYPIQVLDNLPNGESIEKMVSKPCIEYLSEKKMTWKEYYKFNPYGFVFFEKNNPSKSICISLRELQTLFNMPDIHLDVLDVSPITALMKISSKNFDWYFFKKSFYSMVNENVGGVVMVSPILKAKVRSKLEKTTEQYIYNIQILKTNFTPLTFNQVFNNNSNLLSKIYQNHPPIQWSNITIDTDLDSLKSKGKKIIVDKKFELQDINGEKLTINQFDYLPKSYLKYPKKNMDEE